MGALDDPANRLKGTDLKPPHNNLKTRVFQSCVSISVMKVLPKSFFRRPVLKVAPELLGKYLVREMPTRLRQGYGGRRKIERFLITEVEAYDGLLDLANHASKGKTDRTKIMFESGGVWYVYLVYGMHEMLNVVTGDADYPAAVLIRGVENISGPGRLTKKLQINRKLNGKPASKETGLWIEDNGEKISASKIIRTPRIGVAYAKEWAQKPYRFVLKR
jgi:DNA-3-methyladenine glycosylase